MTVQRVVVAALALVLVGCAVQQAIKRYEDTLNPLVGKATREDIALQFGAPTRRETVGEIEVWYYHKSFGRRVEPGVMGSVNIREVLDDLTLWFDKRGILSKWRVWVQR